MLFLKYTLIFKSIIHIENSPKINWNAINSNCLNYNLILIMNLRSILIIPAINNPTLVGAYLFWCENVNSVKWTRTIIMLECFLLFQRYNIYIFGNKMWKRALYNFIYVWKPSWAFINLVVIYFRINKIELFRPLIAINLYDLITLSYSKNVSIVQLFSLITNSICSWNYIN